MSLLTLARRLALPLLAAVLLVAPAARAAPVPFSGIGGIGPVGDNGLPPPDFRLRLEVFAADYTVDGVAGWRFTISNWLYDPFTGHGEGDFEFSHPSLGSIVGHGEQQALTFEVGGAFDGVPLTLNHRYVATGGTGLYAGFQGSADSTVARGEGTPIYVESGRFVAAVPEPAPLLLAALAAAAALGLRRRQGLRPRAA